MKPYLSDPDFTLYNGDALEVLRELPDESVHMCVTSPPFYGLRDYGTGTWKGGDEGCDHAVRPNIKVESSTLGGGKATTGHQREGFGAECPRCGARRVDQQIGLEATPDEWIAKLVAVFREVRRVLRKDGTCWVEVGDSYGSGGHNGKGFVDGGEQTALIGQTYPKSPYKPKDLLGQPWALAFALRADGWYLRSEIIWAKPNPMPESCTDRPTTAHSRIFLLAKSPRYYFDQEAVREQLRPGSPVWGEAHSNQPGWSGNPNVHGEKGHALPANPAGRNIRSVWEIATEAFPDAHFATFPQALVRRCILAGCPEGGIVLDPFGGSGTTALVARKHGRRSILIELSEPYCEMAAKRLSQLSLLAEVT